MGGRATDRATRRHPMNGVWGAFRGLGGGEKGISRVYPASLCGLRLKPRAAGLCFVSFCVAKKLDTDQSRFTG